MMRTKVAMLLLTFFVVTPALAGEPEVDTSSMTKHENRQEKTKMWAAVPLGYFVGFGLGQALQGQYVNYGWAFTIADAAGFALLFGSLGDCGGIDCRDRQNERARASLVILAASRLTQTGDTWIRAMKYDGTQTADRSSVGISIVPLNKGGVLQLATTF